MRSHDWTPILELCENYKDLETTPITNNQLKQQAAEYLHTDIHKKLTRHELRSLLAKAEKMRSEEHTSELQSH